MIGPTWSGVATYRDHAAPDRHARIVVTVRVGPSSAELEVVVDTGGADILDPKVARLCGVGGAPSDPVARLMVRGVSWQGRLVRCSVTLLADEGEDLEIEATWFVPDDSHDAWANPSFLGYQGSLSRMRFAVDPQSNRLWFAAMD